MKFNAMELVTFLQSIYYIRCVYLVFLVSVPIATPYDSMIARPVNINKSVPLTPELLQEINHYNNEHMDQDVAQLQLRHESTVDPKIHKRNPSKLVYIVESPEKFIWFIHNIIKILIKYVDTDLKQFFHVIHTELDRYEKSESHHLSRFISSELNKLENMSAATLREQLSTIDASMEKENQEKSQKKLTDYINSLYGRDYVQKFVLFLFNIDDYGFMITKNIDLGSILRDGLKSIIFDRYSKLDHASREKFIPSIKRYFKYITKSPSLIGGNEREDVDETDLKLPGGINDNYTATKMKGMHDELIKNIAFQNVKSTIKAMGKNKYKEEPYVNEHFTKKPTRHIRPVTIASVRPTIVSTWSTVSLQSDKTQFRYSPIKTLGPVNVRGNKATLKSKNTGTKSTASKHDIFIDIQYPTHLKVSVEHKVQRKRNKRLMRSDSKYPRLSITEHSTKRNKNLPADNTNKSSKGKCPISAKRLDLSAPHKVKEIVNYRRKNDRNETADRFEIKKKVLARLYQLENDIKLVKSQIDNDSRTIKDLENQIHQKEKERAKLNLIKDKKNIMKKQDYMKGTSDNIYETKQNTSYDENVPDFQGPPLNIFDQLDDVKYETFENYDGEFDWEKFVTSNLYIQQLKNSTAAEILDGRRMLDEELTTPIFNAEEHPPIEALKNKPEFWNEYDMDEPRESILFTLPPRNISNDRLVPQPGINKFIDSMGISLEIPDPLNMKKSEDPELKFDLPSNLRFGLKNGRRILPDDQSVRDMMDSRRNMYTSTSAYDKVLNDPIIRDIDKAVDF